MTADATDRVIARLLRVQSGVISRCQVVAAGGKPFRIVRLLARHDWARMMDGVYVDHTDSRPGASAPGPVSCATNPLRWVGTPHFVRLSPDGATTATRGPSPSSSPRVGTSRLHRADSIALLLESLGWTGSATTCPECRSQAA